MRTRKIALSVLPGFVFFFTGCYSTGVVTKEELQTKAETIDVTLLTQDSTEYRFLKGNYQVQSGSLTGFGLRTRGANSDIVLDASLPLAQINSIQYEEFEAARTIG